MMHRNIYLLLLCDSFLKSLPQSTTVACSFLKELGRYVTIQENEHLMKSFHRVSAGNYSTLVVVSLAIGG
jgi:hypothetical protein